jgi:hypothetical protein
MPRQKSRTSDGMQFTAMVLKWGPIPPVHEPARTHFLTQAGRRELQSANRASLEATHALSRHIPTDRFPFAMGFAQDWDVAWQRYQRWQVLACQLRLTLQSSDHEELPGEAAARRALTHAAGAFRYLRRGPLERAADLQLHRIGELVGGLYGCWHEYKNERWFDTCLVRMAHLHMGLSAGFTAKRLCSICGDDFSECVHDPDWLYPVTAERTDGDCNICGASDDCDHPPGTEYLVRPTIRLDSAVMREVSLTPNPRDPSLMITSLQSDPQPPPPTSLSYRRRCLACMSGICEDPGADMSSRALEDHADVHR